MIVPTTLLKKQVKKKVPKIFNFLIDPAMVTSNTKPTVDEPQTFNEAWNHPNNHKKMA